MKVNLDNAHCLLPYFLLCPGEYREYDAIEGKANGCKRIWYHRVENYRVCTMKVNPDNSHCLKQRMWCNRGKSLWKKENKVS